MSLKQVQTAWHSLLLTSFTECSLTRSDCPAAPTFRRGTTCSTIDYIFASESLLVNIHASAVDFLQPTWTDHALLTTSFKFVQNHQGPGLWRANPHLTKNAFFINDLSTALEKFHDSMVDSALSVQDQWDLLKTTVRSVAHTTARRKAEWRQRELKRLQLETQIGALQLDAAVNDTLRAGRHWQEHGETSAGFLKRTIEQKAVKRLIPELRHPESNEICSTPPHVELLTNSIPTTDRLSDTCHSLITRPFHISEIRRSASRSPRRSSPGPDGHPYEILCVDLENERSAALATKVYSDALQNALYPSSWQETCMSLLPKKGDLTSLKNWRPISLINTDAKAFTRLLNARLMSYLSKIITTNQLGFMPGRFIADHDQLVKDT
ncbi:hypothetical protein G6F37_012271 [Rhizopus arrhizus]|nr:hypothetical protein G6F37_012271 [Rhizopus arrhizus]